MTAISPSSVTLRLREPGRDRLSLSRAEAAERGVVRGRTNTGQWRPGYSGSRVSYEEGLALARNVVEKYEKKFPEAMRILSEDLEACLVVLKLPLKHRRVVRTTNLLERLFGENRRRTKVIPHFFQEAAAMKLIYATLVAASKKWRGVELTTVMYRELSHLRDEVLP